MDESYVDTAYALYKSGKITASALGKTILLNSRDETEIERVRRMVAEDTAHEAGVLNCHFCGTTPVVL